MFLDLGSHPLDLTDADAQRPADVLRFARRRLAGPSSRPILAGRRGPRGHGGGSAEPERDRKRYGAAHQPHRVDQDDRRVADAKSVEQPDRSPPDVDGEEAHRDVAGGAAGVHPSRLQEHGEGPAQAVDRRGRA